MTPNFSELVVTAAEDAVPIVPVTAETHRRWEETAEPASATFARTMQFTARAGTSILIPDAGGRPREVLAGLGTDRAPADAGSVAGLSASLPPGRYRFAGEVPGLDPARRAIAWAQGQYRFSRYRSQPDARPGACLVEPALGETGLARVRAVVEAMTLVRTLVDTPANDMGPEELEAAARDLAQSHGAAFGSIVGEALLSERLPLVHWVGRASSRPPRLLDLRWGAADAPRLTLVGKGVCFDSGGLNLKPGSSMANMKKDMGGAAHVLGLAHVIMALKLPVRLRVLVPAVENAVSGSAFRPGDILPSRKGLSVEIGNTDAEGRLILADALALADEESPDLLIDMATLTGAARQALGPDLPPFYTMDEALAAALAEAARREQDPLWRLPLHAPYQAWLDGKLGDVNHIGDTPMAGSIVAALFLQRFVEAARAFVHFDIYAWNDKARPGRPGGAAVQGLLALLAIVEARYKRG
ncbi:MAG: leucyl aminopeptidase family protein [Alphaproteobacteria bacterium]|nr:leucyl aminopeptidase family protein [Alphaproteobacteria bacterium]